MPSFGYDLAMALIPGSMAGYYSGLLIAKLSKFNALKYEALRAVRSVNHMGDDQGTQILRSDKVEDLHLIASELFSLQHKTAGMTVMAVSNDLLNAIAACETSSYDAKKLQAQLTARQGQLRAIKPSMRFFLPWGQI
ncbi:hypothetical protein [uncultured Xanthomonas sp.]|uniref:hypothetical protein n=1 Tax=uncultured Xanthomonas sp. TaxID=152831 RepID=UPI0025DE91C2|nr:hypothetical protein [uncultured Xanthomonas sp.]